MVWYRRQYRHGINLGGWLSQCEARASHTHFSSFITREDILRIAKWGFDHVRLPVDSTVITFGNGYFDQTALGIIDDCLTWCREANLGLLLDMHRLPGYNIATPYQNDLFISEKQLSHTSSIWSMFARRYLHIGDELRFEILNEPEWECAYPVNSFYSKIVSQIRSIDPLRVILIGGNHYYHVNSLECTQIIDDANVIYTFHYYEPNLFTNQLHDVNHNIKDAYPESVTYPGQFSNLTAYLDKHPDKAKASGKYCWTYNNHDLMVQYLQKASDFRKNTCQKLYLGEFGVCYYADSKSRCAWISDVIELMDKNQIGWCYWTYKEMDYGLVNIKGEVIDQDVLNTLQDRCTRE